VSGETRAKDAGSAGPRLAILEGIRPYDRTWLAGDVLAGVTLAALGIPEVMGYTKISGTPVITGLYTLLLPILVFAILGSSRHLVVAGDPRPRRSSPPGSEVSGSPTSSRAARTGSPSPA
jgi:hypothetical protein